MSCTETNDRMILTEISGLPQHVFDPNARCSHPKKSELLGNTPQKFKAKTRPDGQTPSPMQESRRDSATSTEEKDHTEVKKIKVNKRAFKVFATMFHVPSANEQQNTGEVAWSEFLYSMKMIGFSVEKLYGSSWQFTPDTIDVQRSIQFHEPHPRAKIWYWLMKNFGRRLHRYVITSDALRHLLTRTQSLWLDWRNVRSKVNRRVTCEVEGVVCPGRHLSQER